MTSVVTHGEIQTSGRYRTRVPNDAPTFVKGLKWHFLSLFSVQGLRDGTHPVAARTCEPRPLAQARQIRPAAPVGALKRGARPTDRYQDNPSGVGRFAGQARTRSRPYAHTRPKPRKQGQSTYPHPPCRIGAADSSTGEAHSCAPIIHFWAFVAEAAGGRLGAGVAAETGESGRGLVRRGGDVPVFVDAQRRARAGLGCSGAPASRGPPRPWPLAPGRGALADSACYVEADWYVIR
jgi:hypothetical protein